MTTPPEAASTRLHRARQRAGRLALLLGILIFVGKFTAYALTGSTAIFADAMESTVNIVAAGLMVMALALAARPPDQDHPYGHGKVEFMTAGIEGAAIAAAALVILAESIREMVRGPQIASLDLGLLIITVCTLANGVLGLFLIQQGRRTDSIALEADGRHLMTDVWTSFGVIGGLLVVRTTGWVWADPLVAMAVALNVVREGAGLIRRAFEGLMDRADPETLEAAAEDLAEQREETWIEIHRLRSWSSGARRHYDLHITVPRYLDVERLHEIHDRVEQALLGRDPHGGDVVVHFDPCTPSLCPRCPVSDCSIREAPFERPVPATRERVTLPDEEAHPELHGQGDAAAS